MGDWLLMEITHRLQDYLSGLEIKTFLARACGDEFIILLDNIQTYFDGILLFEVVLFLLVCGYLFIKSLTYAIVCNCNSSYNVNAKLF